MILNNNQNLLGKTMLVLNRHLESVADLTVDEWAELHALIQRAAAALSAAFGCDHFNYAFLQNQDRHVHMHVVPRYSSERIAVGRTFLDSSWPDHYVVGEVVTLSDSDLAGIAATIGSEL
jgi:diadenosine tetraphosphate (Ap4A) HIT family hydrolase